MTFTSMNVEESATLLREFQTTVKTLREFSGHPCIVVHA